MRGTLGGSNERPGIARIIPAHAGNSVCPLHARLPGTDHPRACGELGLWDPFDRDSFGSSPRMRGTHATVVSLPPDSRIIPAHAGNSWAWHDEGEHHPDHPRACGELASAPAPITLSNGSSPRMRGTPFTGKKVNPLDRIIPAHAGNSCPTTTPARCLADHPRACGELTCAHSRLASVIGSSPRMRGTRSPRPFRRRQGWIIPAHAGNSRRHMAITLTSTDHPRACGELIELESRDVPSLGSSPRMRGTPQSAR